MSVFYLHLHENMPHGDSGPMPFTLPLPDIDEARQRITELLAEGIAL